MKPYQPYVLLYPILSLLILTASCIGQVTKENQGNKKTNDAPTGKPNLTWSPDGFKADPAVQISQYIRRIFQDKAGNLWFGTNGDGVSRYDGKSLVYFNEKDGFSGSAVRGIAEDKNGNLWFGTDRGVICYDPSATTDIATKPFTVYTEKDGLPDNDIWSLLIDKNGTIWVGTIAGVARYNAPTASSGDTNIRFTPFKIPPPTERDFNRGVISKTVIWDIAEDKAGNIWFATNGGGVYRYDRKKLENLSKKDGLADIFVNDILEDRNGNLWFATQHNGISMYNGKSFTNFTTKEGLCGNEAWRLFEDKAGNIWISVRGSVCRFDGKAFTTFTAKEGLTNCCVQSILEDRSGRFWFGSGAGLFRYDGKWFINVTKNGPWE